MTPDDRLGEEEPTKPLPVEPEPTEPLIAPHVPVANLTTAPLDPLGAASPLGRTDRSRAFMWGLVAAVAVLGVLLIVVLTTLLGDTPAPAGTPTPSTTPSVTPSPSELPPSDEGTPSEEPEEPAPEPTTPPEPTDPPDPEPTETPAAAAT